MREKNRPKRTRIASYVGPRAFARQTDASLAGLGYFVVPAFAMGRFDDISWLPSLRLVDERHYERIPSFESDPKTPVILLTGARPKEIEDPRIVGRVPRPAELAELYPLIQRALEPTPRSAARVETRLSARCIRADRRHVGSVTSLSERGCLFRSHRPIDSGSGMNLQLALPGSGIISMRAVCVRRHDGAAGLVFANPSLNARRSIGGFVNGLLATW